MFYAKMSRITNAVPVIMKKISFKVSKPQNISRELRKKIQLIPGRYYYSLHTFSTCLFLRL